MRVLITGAAGFLGSHLTDAILDEGHEVLAVDNLYTGSKQNLLKHFTNPNFEFIRHDVTQPLHVEIDFIFNLACPASPVHYQKFPVQTIKTSIIGAVNMLGLARRLSVPIFQASTSEVYGDPNVSPQPEEYWGNVNPIGIRACYDEGKRAAESLFFDYNRQYGLNIKVARIFNTYGPRMNFHDGRVVSNFIYQALKNQDITIYGTGEQSRSFCYVTDLISAFLKFMKTGNDVTGPINLGNPTEFTMLELAEKIIKISNSKSKISFEPLPGDDPKQRKPNIDKAREILKWEPEVTLEKGLLKTLEDFQLRL
jgi:UDP-glucuronate decarboxylase